MLRPMAPRRRPWLWFAFAATSALAVGLLAYVARTACPAVVRGRLAEIDAVHQVAVAPDGQAAFLATVNGLFRGARLGREWEPARGLCRQDVTAVAFANDQQAWLAGHSLGVMRSEDGGRTFREAAAGLPARDVHGLAVPPGAPGQAYAWVVGAGLWTTGDGGATWSRLAEGALGVQDVYGLAPHPSDPRRLFAAGAAGLARSADGGLTWAPVPGLPGPARGVAVAPGAPERWYVAAGSQGLLYTDDAGRTWQRFGSIAGEVAAVAVSPASPRTVLAVTDVGQVYLSSNGGESWSPR